MNKKLALYFSLSFIILTPLFSIASYTPHYILIAHSDAEKEVILLLQNKTRQILNNLDNLKTFEFKNFDNNDIKLLCINIDLILTHEALVKDNAHLLSKANHNFMVSCINDLKQKYLHEINKQIKIIKKQD